MQIASLSSQMDHLTLWYLLYIILLKCSLLCEGEMWYSFLPKAKYNINRSKNKKNRKKSTRLAIIWKLNKSKQTQNTTLLSFNSIPFVLFFCFVPSSLPKITNCACKKQQQQQQTLSAKTDLSNQSTI